MPLSVIQQQGVAALLTSRTQRAAAEKIGVAEETFSEWMQHEDFQAALNKATVDLIKHTLRRLKSLSNDAVDRLGVEMEAAATSKDRITASDKILSHLTRFVDVIELQEKVAELQAKMADSSPANHEHTAADSPHRE